MKNRSIERTILGGFGVAVVILVTVAVIALQTTREFMATSRLVAHTQEVLTELEATVSTVKDAETGLRGYLITGDDRYLEPYHEAVARVENQMRHLGELTQDNPDQQGRLPVLAARVRAKLHDLQNAMEVRRERGFEAARRMVLTGQGKQEMNAIRQVIAEMEREERDLLNRRSAESAARGRLTLAIIVVGSLASVGLGVCAFIIVRRELANRQQAREQLERAAEEIRDLYNNAPCGYHSLDKDGTFVAINDTELAWLGYTREEVIGKKTFSDFLTPESLSRFQQNFPVFQEQGWVRDLEFEMIRKDGTILPVLLNATAIKDADGKYIASRTTIFDITDRKLAEEELAKQTSILKAVLSSMGEGVVVADMEGKFLIWNPAAERIVGLGPTNALPEKWSEHYGVYLPDQVTPYPADQLPLARAIRGEFVNADEQFLRHAKAPYGVWLSVTGSPLMDESGMQRGGVVVFGDITDRKRAEEALRRAHDELEQRVRERTAELAMKHRDLETLLYVTSHDLREPLRSIENFSRLVHDRYADRLDEKGRDFLRRVVRGAKRMDKLLADILALSRAQRMETPAEEVDGHAIVQEVLRQLDHVIKKTGATVRVAPDLPKLRVNATWATHGVYNLIANALKFTRDGEAPEIEIASYQPKPDEKVVGLVVRDRGPGVSPEHAERIFQLFQRAVGREVEGTGAGLAIVRQVAERHGGRAWVQPREGGGSEFVLTFGPLGPAERKDIHL